VIAYACRPAQCLIRYYGGPTACLDYATNPYNHAFCVEVIMGLLERFGKGLQKARKSRGLTQEDFSLVSSRTYLSSLERGHKAPTITKIDEIARVLGVHSLSLVALAYLPLDGAEREDSVRCYGVIEARPGRGPRTMARRRTPTSSRRWSSIRRCTTSRLAPAIRLRWSPRPITTTGWFRRTASSTPLRPRPRSPAARRS
jgi:transcriptional regulator with XRE-family HTH domain